MIKKFFQFLIGLFAVVVGFAPNLTTASAAGKDYSSALYDLKKVEAFDESSYPKIAGDTSLKVITIAESIDKEVYVYVYQAGETYKASSINISTSENNVDIYENKTVTLLSQDSVFQKYRIDDLEVSDKDERVYEISSIFRPFDATVDAVAGEGQTISEIAFPVGKRFEINADGMSVTDIELITVTDKYVGFMRHFTSNLWTSKMCDVHYVAFSTDKKIDKLLTADIYYTSQKAGGGEKWPNTTKYQAIEKNSVSLSYKGNLTFENYLWFSPITNEFPMISTADYFIKSEELGRSYDAGIFNTTTASKIKATTKENILSKDWVLRFAVTEYTETRAYPSNELFTSYTIIGDVSVLRLKFETDGEIFDLGVVDNKQTGGREPGNDETTKHGIKKDALLLIILAVIVALMILSPWFRKFVFWILKAVGVVVAWPVLLTILIVQKVKCG